MGVERLFEELPVFETDRLILRRLSGDDAPDYFELASDPIVTARTTWERHRDIKDTLEFLHRKEGQFLKREEYHWGIVLKSTGKLGGRTGFIRIDPEHEKAELGYVLSRHYWNQGVITEASGQIISYGFRELEMNRIEARCNADNVGSYRVMEKLGMKNEGLLRKQLKIKGVFLDQRMYAILREEFI